MKPLKSLIASVCLTAALTTCAYAESMRVSVPFRFHVGETVMPAGTYVAHMDYGRSVLELQALDGNQQCYIPIMIRQANAPTEVGKWVFKGYGNGAYLQTVAPASGYAYQLFPSPREKESATRGAATRIVIAELHR